jgi:ribosomal protein S18 acetylase RimI-like enzyme
MSETTVFHYDDPSVPFGALDIVLPKRDRDHTFLPPMYGLIAQRIITEAWTESDWFQEIVPRPEIDRIASTMDAPFAYAAASNVEAGFINSNRSAAFAIRLAHPDDLRIFSYKQADIQSHQIIGVGDAKVDVSGTRAQKIIKRLIRPEKVYGSVSNVNVRPDDQGQYIGVAIFDALLSSLPVEKKATVYTVATNERLIANLGRIGFSVTGSRPRDNLVRGVTIEEARLEAPSVLQVRQHLAGQFPWLSRAEILRA